MGRKKELAKNTAILTFGKLCTQCINFIMLPLYTALLDTSDYGIFDLLVTYGTVLLPLVNWQLDQGLFRFMLDCRENQQEQRCLFSTACATNTLLCCTYFVILLCISALFKIENVIFLLLYVIFHAYMIMLMQFVRGLGKSKEYAIASFLSATTTVVLNAITLVFFKMGVNGLFFATIASQLITIFYLISHNRIWHYFSICKIRFSRLKPMLRYSVPLIPNNLAWWVVNASDRVVISQFLGVAMNGIFTVASKFSTVFINIYNVINLSWTESVSLHFNDEDRDVFLSEMMTVMFKIFSSACLCIVGAMPFIYPIMVNEKYTVGYSHVLILMYAMLFRVLVGLYSCIYIAQKQSKKVAITSISAAAINLVVDLCLINKVGLYAASLSSLIAFMVMFIIRYVDVNRTIHMKIDTKVFISTMVVCICIIPVYYSERMVLQLVTLIGVIAYSFVINFDLIKQGLKLIRKMMLKEKS